MQKRGSYFFVLDVFIAAAVLMLAIIIILSTRENIPDTGQPYRLAEDYMNFITSTEVRDLSSLYKTELVLKGAMKNSEKKLYQQIAEFEHKSHENETYINISYYFVKGITDGMVPRQYGVSYSINDTVLYNRSNETLEAASLVLVSRKITFFKISDDELYGPKITEVKIWS